MGGLLSADDHGAVGVVHDVVGDGAEDGPADGAHAPGSHHDHVGLLVVGHPDHHLPGLHPALSAELHTVYLRRPPATWEEKEQDKG